MPTLNDPEREKCYKNALANWRYTDFVEFKPLAQEWIRCHLEGYTLREIKSIMHEFVEGGGRIKEQVENRELWLDFEYHYDMTIEIKGRPVYFETVLSYDDPNDPDDPVITVVNVHW